MKYSLTDFDELTTLLTHRRNSLAARNQSARGKTACCKVISPKLIQALAREYAGWFKALADPMRIRILNLLASNREPVCVCDIVKHFPIGQPSVSHHLKILRDTRFVLSERRGTFIYYRINRRCLAEFPHAAHAIMNISDRKPGSTQ